MSLLAESFDGRLALHPPPALAALAAAGILEAADVHVAARLCALAGEDRGEVMLAAALAVRAPRRSDVCVDLGTVAGDIAAAAVATEVPSPTCPAPDAWVAALETSPLVALAGTPDVPGIRRPLRLDGRRLYLDRYWRDERLVAADLLRRAENSADGVDVALLGEGLDTLFPDPEDHEQRVAAACGVLRRLAVIGGGPGTGKTTTIARLLALLDAQPGGLAPQRVALAAPTGKAAQRMQEAIAEAAARMPLGADARARLEGVEGWTLHRLLGRSWGAQTRFRHHRGQRLPHTLVIVDEASMVPLSLLARLLEALRDDARLVLVGDPDQLASVEAGAVLGDVIGPARDTPVRRPAATAMLASALGREVTPTVPPSATPIGDGIAILRHVHRFGGAIATLADAVRRGDADAAMGVLRGGHADVEWIEVDPATATDADVGSVRDAAVSAGTALIAHARAGDAAAALGALDAFRLLCPHRHGPFGARLWGDRVEGWLAGAGALPGTWYPGLPLIVTENDYALRLFNGDTGVIVRGEDASVAVFPRGEGIAELGPARLGSVEPVHAMTIHKSQGSQFVRVALVLAPPESPIATRELVYTAVTRARDQVMLVGTETSLRAAIDRPVRRASGLRDALWGGSAVGA